MTGQMILAAILPLTLGLASSWGSELRVGGVQETPMATLELEAAYPHPFGYLSGLRELPDGSLLAADPLGQVLLKVDMRTGTADTLGRVGQGPEEYRQPDQVLALPGDSTLLVDLGNGRLTVLDPEGAFVYTTPMFRPSADGDMQTLRPSFSDDSGALYRIATFSPGVGPSDSIVVIRERREDPAGESVAALWIPDFERLGRGRRAALAAMDGWGVGSDGRIAVARANGVSVDWYFPDGRAVRGPRYPMEEFPVGEAEREAALDEILSTAIVTFVERSESGTQSRQLHRGVPRGGSLQVGMGDFAWPESLPPFRQEGIHVSPEGEAWVERMVPANHPGRIEVFDDAGRWRGFVELKQGSRLIGFGAAPEGRTFAYLARTDTVGLVWLERHRVLR